MGSAFKLFVVLVINSLALTISYASSYNINTISSNQLTHLFRLNGLDERLASSIISLREKQGWIWSYEEILLSGLPDESLSWFRWRFILDIPPSEDAPYSADTYDFFIYPVDLNNASPSLLALLPTMTSDKIQRLTAYRTHHPLQSPRDLLQLGWSVSEIRALSPWITLSPPTNTLFWENTLRWENTNLLFRTGLSHPIWNISLIIPSLQNQTGNISTIITQSMISFSLSPKNIHLWLGDFRYAQGAGLLFGKPFRIISREVSSIVEWGNGFSLPFSSKKDANENGYDDTLRGIGGEISLSSWHLGGLLTSNQTSCGGGYLAYNQEPLWLCGQLFEYIFTNQNTNIATSLVGQWQSGFLDMGGEYAVAQGSAFLSYIRVRTRRLSLALVGYRGETNFFSPFSGELYRGINGKQGMLLALTANHSPFRIKGSGEYYTNFCTSYFTTKLHLSPIYEPLLSLRYLGWQSISLPLSLDNRTNSFFIREGIETTFWIFSPQYKLTLQAKFSHHNESMGYEYQTRLSLSFSHLTLYGWYIWLSPLKSDPISITFPPLERGEMESSWFYQPVTLFCGGVRYYHNSLSFSLRFIASAKTNKFACSLSWRW